MTTRFTDFYFSEIQRVLSAIDTEKIEDLVWMIFNVWKAGGTVFLLGNGGSAATSSHFACDLAKMTRVGDEVSNFKVLALTDNVPLITAWANDTDYSRVFVEQLRPFATGADLVIGITGSGNSENVLQALSYANKAGSQTAALTGFSGGKVKNVAQHTIVVPYDNMQLIEDVHSLITHAVSLQLRAMLMDYQATGSAARISPRPLKSIY